MIVIDGKQYEPMFGLAAVEIIAREKKKTKLQDLDKILANLSIEDIRLVAYACIVGGCKANGQAPPPREKVNRSLDSNFSVVMDLLKAMNDSVLSNDFEEPEAEQVGAEEEKNLQSAS